MTKSSRQKLKYFENEKSFWRFFIIFKGLSATKKYLRPESAPLILRNHIQNNLKCIIAFLDPLNGKTSRMQRTLSTRKNWFAHVIWMNGKKSEAVVRRDSVKKVFLKIS